MSDSQVLVFYEHYIKYLFKIQIPGPHFSPSKFRYMENPFSGWCLNQVEKQLSTTCIPTSRFMFFIYSLFTLFQLLASQSSSTRSLRNYPYFPSLSDLFFLSTPSEAHICSSVCTYSICM